MAVKLVDVPWHSPLDATANIVHRQPDSACCLLFSGLATSYSGRYSYLAWQEEEYITGESFDLLEPVTLHTTPLPHWFGTLSYEAGHRVHDVTATSPSTIPAPPIAFIRYKHVVRYDHILEQCHYHGEYPHAATLCVTPQPPSSIAHFPPARSLTPHLSPSHYLSIIEATLAQIHAGNFYQANITCKYSGELDIPLTPPAAWEGFTRLHQLSPAPFSAFLSHHGRYILSSSPELFLQVDSAGCITTRPIKGTMNAERSATMLRTSDKDKAENLMIVDLMRNDLAACAITGSVEVPHLWEVDSFRNLHHLSSTITARLPTDYTLANILSTMFPAGSMTGAPKRAAMHWIAAMEGIDRGIYSGALGWINGKACELSVVIRTLIAQQDRYEFQVGGGIVADSDPQAEYAETLIKARALLTLLQHPLAYDT